jgi:hypothetical protein
MRKAFFAALGVLVAVGILAAQTHDNKTEKAVKSEITLSADTRIGTEVLPAGAYRVICDTKEVTFLRPGDNKKVLTVPCQGKHLDKPAADTVAYTAPGPDGIAVMEKLYLRGSNVEHVFPTK